ncbi:unnamed protein product [Danaus chrysippus]|uniref:(African queen) hypothetical protein n=1 Tax=Danaus chrysippus TaxID=151541 RepID=A0A8J2QGZ4_9NEOP|nr:unnamed protein product [Danaus chrysippus]
MSLIKLFSSPIKLFKKDVISFLLIRRHDLGVFDEKLRYIAVRPTASVSQLRRKVWYLLDLPDFCEEIIILKRNNRQIPLTELCKGNDPQHPYVLEVWLPGKHRSSSTLNNMLTMGDNKTIADDFGAPESIFEEKVTHEYNGNNENENHVGLQKETDLKAFQSIKSQQEIRKFIHTDYKKSDLTCKISSSSLFFKLNGRKSRDNFTNMLLKIQSDLTTLNTKLSDLENRIQYS